jgi:hypothetical protein
MNNFKDISDFELIALEGQLEVSIKNAIVQMKENFHIQEYEEELELVREEIKRRNIDG